MKKKKKIFIKTWGCQMNKYDSSMIFHVMKEKGNFSITKKAKKADVLILNTCSIREKAQEKLYHQLGRWKNIKKKNPNIIIAVGGCVATQQGEKIKKREKSVDIIFGTQTLHQLPSMIDKFKKKKTTQIDISFPKNKKFKYFPKLKSSSVKSFVSIIEGCNKYCSFCIVPFTRGREVSRPKKDILYEIHALTKKGVKEITLLGQNVTAYNIKKNNNTIYSFTDLLKSISKIKKIKRIRFITSHPIDFKIDLIQAYKKIPKLTSLLHLPIQSGSNKILKLMKRRYTIKDYKEIIKNLTLIRPNMQITSDFIVGFPGETKKDFKKTLKIIKEINFDMSYSFIYSPRPNTKSIKFNDTMKIKEKKKRLQILQKLIFQQFVKWNRKMLGSIQNVLVEKVSKKKPNYIIGTTENNRIVYFIGNKNLIGKIIKIKITKVNLNSLKGLILNN